MFNIFPKKLNFFTSCSAIKSDLYEVPSTSYVIVPNFSPCFIGAFISSFNLIIGSILLTSVSLSLITVIGSLISKFNVLVSLVALSTSIVSIILFSDFSFVNVKLL